MAKTTKPTEVKSVKPGVLHMVNVSIPIAVMAGSETEALAVVQSLIRLDVIDNEGRLSEYAKHTQISKSEIIGDVHSLPSTWYDEHPETIEGEHFETCGKILEA